MMAIAHHLMARDTFKYTTTPEFYDGLKQATSLEVASSKTLKVTTTSNSISITTTAPESTESSSSPVFYHGLQQASSLDVTQDSLSLSATSYVSFNADDTAFPESLIVESGSGSGYLSPTTTTDDSSSAYTISGTPLPNRVQSNDNQTFPSSTTTVLTTVSEGSSNRNSKNHFISDSKSSYSKTKYLVFAMLGSSLLLGAL
ncbi:hypothetical protein BVG19_g164 [[Candida] boidinii]|nr:hypothetical protein BVG19_g164 [[Candida] boidinii]OWB49732.1 hypothetical protein B5S27_g1274 [[Candida] boidinii]